MADKTGSSSDIKAGGAYLEITARTQALQNGLARAEKLLANFATTGKNMVAGGVTRAFIGLNLALGAARKGYEKLISTAQKMKETGTEEERERIARVEAAVTSLSDAFTKLFSYAVDKLSGPTADALEKVNTLFTALQSIVSGLQDKFDKVFSAIGQGTSKFGELWSTYVNKVIDKSPTLAKAAADALHAQGEKAMEGWQRDNTLLDELDQINDKVNRSADDIKRANDIVAQLNSRWGDVGLSVDQVTGRIEGMGEAQKRVLELQNKARIAQLQAEKLANERQQKALQTANQNAVQKAGPGTIGVLGGWAWNTVKSPFSSSASYKHMTEIAEDQNQGAFERAQEQIAANKAEQNALSAQNDAIDAEIAAIEAGSNWYDEAGRSATDQKKTPVGSNTKAGSMTDKYAGLTNAEAEVAKLNEQYAAMLQERVAQFREHGYSEEEANKLATEEFAEDRKATDEKIARIREEAAKKEADILSANAMSQEVEDANKSDLQKELDSIEQRYIDARKSMIDQLVGLGKSEEEATKLADEHMAAERLATDKLKQLAIRRDQEEQASKRAEEIAKQAEEAKKQEIEDARRYVDEIEQGLKASERSYSSSGGTFSAFDQIDTYNVAAESLNIEKQQLGEQKKLVERMRELIDLYEQSDTTTAVFA